MTNNPFKTEKQLKSSDIKEKQQEKPEDKSKGDGDTNKDAAEEPEQLSDEDEQLKNELEMLLKRLTEPDTKLHLPALQMMATLIRASTSSMTSVPKPLKFMRPHYDTMKDIYKNLVDEPERQLCAEIISVLAMIMGTEKDCLNYRILCGRTDNIGEWGHEYVKHLSSEIVMRSIEVSHRISGPVLELVKKIIPFNMEHNAEADACDLLSEIERMELLLDYVDEAAYPRVCLYLQSIYPYIPEPDNTAILETAFKLSCKFKQHAQAMRLALMLNDLEKAKTIFLEEKDPVVQKQLAFIVARQQVCLDIDATTLPDFEDLDDIMSNANMGKYFLGLARELDVMEPKIPEDIYKSHLEYVRNRFPLSANQPLIDSAKQNLAASFVNGFVNAGFGVDKLITEDGNKWIYKHKDTGLLSATASLGVIMLWDTTGGLTAVDKYFYSKEDHIKAGAILASGILSCGVRSDVEPAHALLSDYVTHENQMIRTSAILGLGIAYAGSNRSIAIDTLKSAFLADSKNPNNIEVLSITALSLGLICVGTSDGSLTEMLLNLLFNLPETAQKDSLSKFFLLSLGLLYLGRQADAEVVLAALKVLKEPFATMAITMVDMCAYAGTGNVLKIQEFLHLCTEHYTTPAKDDTKKTDAKSKESEKDKDKAANKSTTEANSDANKAKDKDGKKSDEAESAKDKDSKTPDLSAAQAIGALGIALVAMGEDIGTEMALRSFGNLLRYCEPPVRRAVPLALGLLYASNPKMKILDTLSKFSHDSDAQVAYSAIFSLGLVGAGTNNSRLAAMLRQLAQYYAKDPNCLFMTRIAQSLAHLGKGTMTLSPYHSDRQLMNPTAVAALLTTLVTCLDSRNLILGKSHYLLYTLVPAIQPRMLVTFDEELRELQVPVRVGMAIDVVGQAGKPKTITGFQTHQTPVLLGIGERAELTTEEYIPMSPVMEGFVILKKNPEYKK